METSVDSLTRDLLEWLSGGPRPYSETMEAWRTSCPRLDVWEQALQAGYVRRYQAPGADRPSVELTAKGQAFLGQRH